MRLEDYPAAHSMDSGWFAVDAHGNLAHFDTGEAGAMPAKGEYSTGEAGDDKGHELWVKHILPWIARNAGPEVDVLSYAEDGVYALFDTATNATAAFEAHKENCSLAEGNELLVEIACLGEDAERFAELDGFVGFAPGLYDYGNEPDKKGLPLALYAHGDWDVPGHYFRTSAPLPGFELDPSIRAELPVMDTSFAEAEEIQLADFYSNDECISWSKADLRTGEMEKQKKSEGLISRVKKFFGG